MQILSSKTGLLIIPSVRLRYELLLAVFTMKIFFGLTKCNKQQNVTKLRTAFRFKYLKKILKTFRPEVITRSRRFRLLAKSAYYVITIVFFMSLPPSV
jgi:hypothetical protein